MAKTTGIYGICIKKHGYRRVIAGIPPVFISFLIAKRRYVKFGPQYDQPHNGDQAWDTEPKQDVPPGTVDPQDALNIENAEHYPGKKQQEDPLKAAEFFMLFLCEILSESTVGLQIKEIANHSEQIPDTKRQTTHNQRLPRENRV